MPLFCLITFLFASDQSLKSIEMGNSLLLKPIKAVKAGAHYGILDFDSGALQVYDATRYLRTIGRRGQGPGEYGNPASFSIWREEIYILEEGTGKIHVFAINGTFRHTIALHLTEQDRFLPCDLLVDDGKLLIAFQSGRGFVQVFARDGYLVQAYEKTKERYPPYLSNAYEMHLKNGHRLWIFSKFDGSLTTLDLRTGKQEQLRHPFTTTEPILDRILESSNPRKGPIGPRGR